jgi:acetolactate synthase-1/2/3 large subunit
MANPVKTTETVAEKYLAKLASQGIKYIFGNAGSDFAPLVEAYSRKGANYDGFPTPVTVAHENLALGMAHGYYLISGEPQAVMVHVNVGTANTLCALLSAFRENIPVILTAGRSPVYECGILGGRNTYIHWGQEMRDQAGMLREMVKWDYELRGPAQVEAVVERAFLIMMQEPRGPVYLMLPREVLAAPMTEVDARANILDKPGTGEPPYPSPISIRQAAEKIKKAKRPLIVTTRAGRSHSAFKELSSFSEVWAIPVVEFWPVYNSLPSDHPMHLGYDVSLWIEEADLVIILEASFPWVPDQAKPRPDCEIIEVARDPLYTSYPMRSFSANIRIAAGISETLQAISAEIGKPATTQEVETREERCGWVMSCKREIQQRLDQRLAVPQPGRISAFWASRCISEAIGPDAIIVNEMGIKLPAVKRPEPGTFFGNSDAGGLGWGLPAALGAQKAAPDRTVIATVGDGSYIYANPVACHQLAAAEELPLLTIVFNNSGWAAVERATLDVYPDGHASRSDWIPWVSLEPSPQYEKIVESCGGHGERITEAEALPMALERAMTVIREERRQALLNIICE